MPRPKSRPAKPDDGEKEPAAEAPKKEPPAATPESPAPAPKESDEESQETEAPPRARQRRHRPRKHERFPPAPATRRLARELGVDLARVAGTGPGDRVSEEDVKAFVRAMVTSQATGRADVKTPPLPDFSRWGEIEKRPVDGIRRKTAEQMSLAWSLIPHVTQHDLADITDLEVFRKEQDGKGPKLTVTAFALKAVAIALREFPQFNASLDAAAGQLILKKYYHIGVAVDTERGLLVPVLRDVNTKNVRVLAQELADVAEKTRQKKIQLEGLRGGTFTITNLGGIGGTGFSPIVNYPEVAILGLSRGRVQPVIHGGAGRRRACCCRCRCRTIIASSTGPRRRGLCAASRRCWRSRSSCCWTHDGGEPSPVRGRVAAPRNRVPPPGPLRGSARRLTIERMRPALLANSKQPTPQVGSVASLLHTPRPLAVLRHPEVSAWTPWPSRTSRSAAATDAS